MNLERLETLVGENNLNIIKNLNIAIIGIGGVGGYALESLVRCGIENITIIDYDKIDATNLNRQIITNENNIGNYKVDEAIIRYKNINSKLNLKGLKERVNKDNINGLLNEKYDYIVDACDDIDAKIEIMRYAEKNNIKIISSMGMAKKLDATKIYITTLNKTEYDPLAKKIRGILRKEELSLKVPVVCSKEEPSKTKLLGSSSYVPAVAGLLITNYIINEICN